MDMSPPSREVIPMVASPATSAPSAEQQTRSETPMTRPTEPEVSTPRALLLGVELQAEQSSAKTASSATPRIDASLEAQSATFFPSMQTAPIGLLPVPLLQAGSTPVQSPSANPTPRSTGSVCEYESAEQILETTRREIAREIPTSRRCRRAAPSWKLTRPWRLPSAHAPARRRPRRRPLRPRRRLQRPRRRYCRSRAARGVLHTRRLAHPLHAHIAAQIVTSTEPTRAGAVT